MNLSMKWLNDYVKADMPIKEFADVMTMSGSKVEKWTDLSEPLKNIVVGKVISIERHADSDKLWTAQVDVGKKSPVQIVTGASNVYAGAFVPVVLDGGAVIDRHNKSVTEIKKGMLRGVLSEGMMCSFDELGMENADFPYSNADGILILNGDPDFDKIKVGMDVTEFVGLKDISVEFEITNNRPDCLSVLGLARETSAAFGIPFESKTPAIKGVNGSLELEVEVKTNLCSRYMAAVVKNVKIEPSPRWLRERLHASGVRAINNYVDITNYVMLEYGHPMHAFDKKYVAGDKIIIRDALNGEKITLLDGSEQILGEETMIIADTEKPIAVAGVMGGEFSGIMDGTETVVFESACFDGVSVRRAAKRIGRRTESSSRFEKGIDPINARDALYRALELVELLNCGEVVETVIDVNHSGKEPVSLKHSPDKINAILGTDISAAEQLDILKRLGFGHETHGNESYVIPPHVRIDIETDCDLAEEVARIYGYDKIKPTVPLLGTQGIISPDEVFENKIISVMLGQGLYECLSYGFISPKAYAKANIADCKSVVIRNPLGEDTGVMRMSVLPSMLDILSRNYNNRISAARFFEIMRVFLPDGKNDEGLPDEKKVLAIGLYGADEDFFSLKGIIEELLEKCGANPNSVRYNAIVTNKSYHAGRCAEITVNGTVVGVFGEVNPIVSERYDIGTRTYTAEISLSELYGTVLDAQVPRFKALPKYPAMTRDLSLICGENVSSGEISDIIKESADGGILEQVGVFDVYRGGQIPEGKKSLSYKLVLRKSGGTLTDKDADELTQKVLQALAEKDIVLRK